MYDKYNNQNDYWENKRDEYYNNMIMAKNIKRILVFIGILAAMAVAVFILSSCRTSKTGVNENTNTSDSVKIEYREKIVKVPVTVYVEIPVESKVQIDRDSSHLETSVAISEAKMVWIDGVLFLRHTLDNKPQKIAKSDSVPVTEKEKVVWKTRRVAYTKMEIREKRLTWWQTGLMWAGGIFSAIFILFIGFYIIRFHLRR